MVTVSQPGVVVDDFFPVGEADLRSSGGDGRLGRHPGEGRRPTSLSFFGGSTPAAVVDPPENGEEGVVVTPPELDGVMTAAADVVLSTLARSQSGHVSRRQLRSAGLSARQIDGAVGRRLLVAVHLGVYRHSAWPESATGRIMAAVLGAGDGAVASHRSAARLWGLRDVPRWRPEVTVAGASPHVRAGIVVHRSDRIDPEDRATVDGVPTTAAARTLLDLGAVVPFGFVLVAAQDALLRRVVDLAQLLSALERLGRRGRRGTAALRAAVAASTNAEALESELEAKLYRRLRESPLPAPTYQHELRLVDRSWVRLDVAWPEHRVALEADGRRWHAIAKDFERDLARHNAILASGWRCYRVGWTDLTERWPAVLDLLEGALRGGPAPALSFFGGSTTVKVVDPPENESGRWGSLRSVRPLARGA